MSPKLVESLNGTFIEKVSSANGCEHLSLITDDGKLYTCGYNNYGQLGHGTQANLSTPTLIVSLKNKFVTYVSCSYYHSIIVTSEDPQNTEIYSVGRNDSGQLGQEHSQHEFIPKAIRNLSNRQVIQTACGLHHSVFVTTTGEVFSCGFNDNGQLGHGDTKSRNIPQRLDNLHNKFFVEVACGYYHTILRND